jgi:hypothetical protein
MRDPKLINITVAPYMHALGEAAPALMAIPMWKSCVREFEGTSQGAMLDFDCQAGRATKAIFADGHAVLGSSAGTRSTWFCGPGQRAAPCQLVGTGAGWV